MVSIGKRKLVWFGMKRGDLDSLQVMYTLIILLFVVVEYFVAGLPDTSCELKNVVDQGYHSAAAVLGLNVEMGCRV